MISAEQARASVRCAECGELVCRHRIVIGIVIHPGRVPT